MATANQNIVVINNQQQQPPPVGGPAVVAPGCCCSVPPGVTCSVKTVSDAIPESYLLWEDRIIFQDPADKLFQSSTYPS